MEAHGPVTQWTFERERGYEWTRKGTRMEQDVEGGHALTPLHMHPCDAMNSCLLRHS